MHWINLILDYVTTVSYSILIIGEPQPVFKPTRGICQGDPLSHYLFIICTEAFSSLLCHAERMGCISSVAIGLGLVAINHLLFVDDCLLFCQANSIEWSNMVSRLNLYEHVSGQFLNKDKTSLFFSNNTPVDVKNNLTLIVGVKAQNSFEKYLGLPAIIGRNKTKSFQSLLDRTRHRISNWKAIFLSNAGKEVLIRSILQAIPSYTEYLPFSQNCGFQTQFSYQ